MSFPRYPKYKDSGIEWLGAVPEHWITTKTKHVVQFTTGWTPPTGDAAAYEGDNLWANISDLGPKWICDPVKRVSDDAVDSSRIKISPKGSLLFSFKLSIGQVSFAGRDLFTNEAIATFLPSATLWLGYAYYAFPIFLVQNAAENIYGARLLNQELIRAASFSLPPVPEQTAIAAFLDRDTAKIDALVAEQRRLIDLLKEKRQAVISHAVTKGLNPHAPMKPSGNQWLGEVPKHWRVGAVKYLVLPKRGAIKTGPFGSHLTSAEMQSGSIKVYNQRNVIDDDFESGDNFISDEKFVQLASFETFPGDLLVTTRGTIGRVGILPESAERGILHPCLLRLQADHSKVDTQFLKTLIQDSDLVQTQLSYLSNATTIEVIYSDTMASVIIPVPPLSEQKAIVQFLNCETATLDALTIEAQRAIDLLQERRTTLISAAVTGKIDVRGDRKSVV